MSSQYPTLAQGTIVERKGDNALDRSVPHTLAHPAEMPKVDEAKIRASIDKAPKEPADGEAPTTDARPTRRRTTRQRIAARSRHRSS